MCNKKLYRLFVEGRVSLTLIGLWLDSNDRSDEMANWETRTLIKYTERRLFWITIFWATLLSFVGVFLHHHTTSASTIVWTFEMIGQIMAIVITIIAGVVFYLKPNYNKLLIKDLEKFSQLIGSCGVKTITELQECTKSHLVAIAREIVFEENRVKKFASVNDGLSLCVGPIQDALKIKEERFVPHHKLFRQFGLVERRWGTYFAEATRLEKEGPLYVYGD